jgi:GNAT superfamily N-acetyltransferase
VRGWFASVVVPSRELWLADALGAEPAAILVIEDDLIAHLYVEPGLTGRGIGAALLDHAKREHAGGLQLWAFESNVPARRFYERHGFIEVERADGSGNEEREPDVRYVWVGPDG